MIRAIAFDLGGVFATNPPRHVIREIALKTGIDIMDVLKAWNRYWTSFITGKLTEDQFFESIIRELHIEGHRRETIEEYKELTRHFISIEPDVYNKIVQLKEKLNEERHRFRFALISNTAKEWWEYLTSDHDFSVFDVVVTSFEEKTAKPGEKLFEKLVEKLKVKPTEVLFIDDKASNCDAARGLGMAAYQYQDFRGVVDELRRCKAVEDKQYNDLIEALFESEEDEEDQNKSKNRRG